MLWLIFTLIAVFGWSIVEIIDVHVIKKEMRDPRLAMTIFCVVACLIFICLSSIMHADLSVSLPVLFAALIAGIIYSGAVWLDYQASRVEKLSSFTVILATEPLVIALLACLFFNESLSWLRYLGIGIIVLGAYLVVHEKHGKKIGFGHLLAFGAMIFFALRNLFMRFITSEVDFYTSMFWFGVGGLIIPVLMIIFHHPHLIEKAKAGVWHIVLSALISAGALLSFMAAISTGVVTLPSAILATKPLLVFLLILLLSFFHSKFFKEPMSRTTMVKRVMAIALIIVGGMLIVW